MDCLSDDEGDNCQPIKRTNVRRTFTAAADNLGTSALTDDEEISVFSALYLVYLSLLSRTEAVQPATTWHLVLAVVAMAGGARFAAKLVDTPADGIDAIYERWRDMMLQLDHRHKIAVRAYSVTATLGHVVSADMAATAHWTVNKCASQCQILAEEYRDRSAPRNSPLRLCFDTRTLVLYGTQLVHSTTV